MTIQQRLDATTLKLIACAAMFIDHVGAVFFPEVMLLRFVGRIAFPIFAYLLCEGMEHTRDKTMYMRNLLLLALVSEPFFDLAFGGRFLEFGTQNTVFTLLLGAITIYFCEQQGSWIFGMIGMVAGNLLQVDYGEYGVMLVVLFWYYRKLTVGVVSSLLGFAACFAAPVFMDILLNGARPEALAEMLLYCGVFLVLPLLLGYNGKRGGKNLPILLSKWGFYLFYPLHLALLFLLRG